VSASAGLGASGRVLSAVGAVETRPTELCGAPHNRLGRLASVSPSALEMPPSARQLEQRSERTRSGLSHVVCSLPERAAGGWLMLATRTARREWRDRRIVARSVVKRDEGI
jgi:hypothetical protein